MLALPRFRISVQYPTKLPAYDVRQSVQPDKLNRAVHRRVILEHLTLQKSL